MSRDGSGTYVLPSGQPVVTEAFISSIVHNVLAEDLAATITQSLSKDGQTVPTGDLPMGGFKHTSLADGVAINQAATLGQVQRNAGIWCGTNGGSANAITLQVLPGQTAYSAGMILEWVASITNTTAVTLNLNGLGVKDLVKFGAKPLQASDLKAALHYRAIYDGTRFQLLNPSADQPTAADQLWYGSSDGVWAQTPLTAAGRSLIGSSATSLKLLIDVQVFTASGTWTNPAGATLWNTKGSGGGGGGGGTQTTAAGQYAVGGGGGGGGYVEETIVSGVGPTETITIGAGGSATPGAGGSSGGSTSFGSHWTAGGGGGGALGNATNTGIAAFAAGGVGGTATGSTIACPGEDGERSFSMHEGGVTTDAIPGDGGGSVLGHGGAGRSFFSLGAARAGKAMGGGGAGAVVGSSTSATAGGVGAGGFLVIESYA